MTAVRILIGYLLAVAVAAALGSVVSTQMVIAGFGDAAPPVPFADRLSMTISDFAAFGPQFGAVVAVALAIGFVIAFVLKRILKPLAPVAYPLAGAAAIATALIVMQIKYDGITPIASARTALGFALLCAAGAVGGLVFAALAGRKAA